MAHTQPAHPGSLHPGVSCAWQQPTSVQPQAMPQDWSAKAAQVSVHGPWQQSGCCAHTHGRQSESAHSAFVDPTQQSGVQGHTEAHSSPMAPMVQTPSQLIAQHHGSNAQIQDWQAVVVHPGPGWGAQQVSSGAPQATQTCVAKSAQESLHFPKQHAGLRAHTVVSQALSPHPPWS